MFTNWLTSTSSGAASEQSATSSFLSTPPDMVLEVGAAPGSVRFMAHSLVLGMHSGYLRSAIRVDEQQLAGSGSAELVIYLANVTAEQFAPLLTYMYTGYLDLNVENIFGVLLATHVLHMPRALEICRAFLASAQPDGYLSNATLPNLTPLHVSTPSANKIIRPIASKASLPLFPFAPTPLPQPLALQLNCYKNLPAYQAPAVAPAKANTPTEALEIDVDCSSSGSSAQVKDKATPELDEEDEEVFIDSSSATDNEQLDTNVPLKSNAALVQLEPVKATLKVKRQQKKTQKREKRLQTRRQKPAVSGGLQVAKAPIPASQLEPIEGTKVIIDVASCDGPVRFRRILNAAYGHKPDAYDVAPERTQQSLSLSFHQQMARTISQQRQLQQSEQCENKQLPEGKAAASKSNSSEIYVCVYCKHTFKSQYCYQKHAKRHLNPLSLSSARAAANTSCETPSSSNETADKTPTTTTPPAELLRREVRPLDMNVQYYPCKTCGSKFPSYYFVHKHRKLCHADEEASEASSSTRATKQQAESVDNQPTN